MKPQHKASTDDLSAETRPSYVIEPWDKNHPSPRQRTIRRGIRMGCLVIFAIFACILFIGGIYLLVPFRTDFLILGIDRTPEGTGLGRSDTNILVTVRSVEVMLDMLRSPLSRNQKREKHSLNHVLNVTLRFHMVLVLITRIILLNVLTAALARRGSRWTVIRESTHFQQ